ncbi:unnamed protein product [Amaranthus hypochondriacus]
MVTDGLECTLSLSMDDLSGYCSSCTNRFLAGCWLISLLVVTFIFCCCITNTDAVVSPSGEDSKSPMTPSSGHSLHSWSPSKRELDFLNSSMVSLSCFLPLLS